MFDPGLPNKTETQIANVDLALRLWLERVRPEQVYPGLRSFKCGTLSCFWGHVQRWEEFGLRHDSWPDCGHADRLFGECSEGLWAPRGGHWADYDAGFTGSDHALVVHRLTTHRQRLLESA